MSCTMCKDKMSKFRILPSICGPNKGKFLIDYADLCDDCIPLFYETDSDALVLLPSAAVRIRDLISPEKENLEIDLSIYKDIAEMTDASEDKIFKLEGFLVVEDNEFDNEYLPLNSKLNITGQKDGVNFDTKTKLYDQIYDEFVFTLLYHTDGYIQAIIDEENELSLSPELEFVPLSLNTLSSLSETISNDKIKLILNNKKNYLIRLGTIEKDTPVYLIIRRYHPSK